MTELGKPVVFWLKYMAEMNRLYYPESHAGEDVAGLEDADQVKKMAGIVGDVASGQVADFLELCGKAIEKHFADLKIARPGWKRSRSYVKTHWEWESRFDVPSVRGGWFDCGLYLTAPPEVRVTLDKNACGVVVPYLWSTGGRRAADTAWDILGGRAYSRDGDGLIHSSGTITLACIHIKPQPPKSFEVDRDHLVAEVMKAISRIGAKETKAIAKYIAGLKETDED